MRANAPLILCTFLTFIGAEGVSDQDMTTWAGKISDELSRLKDLMAFDHVKQTYDSSTGKFSTKTLSTNNAEAMLKLKVDKVKSFMSLKEKLVENIRTEVEMAYEDDSQENRVGCDNVTSINYYRAKAVTTQSTDESKDCTGRRFVSLQPDPLIHDVTTNRAFSTVHVPTNVYDMSQTILNNAYWTRNLDETFKKNFQNDSSVKWQYFGAASGFFRIYPGIMWNIQIAEATTAGSAVDFFDCRSQHWYLEGSSYPKDVVVIIDISGSMKGRRILIANHTLTEILNTLTENDFFNVLLFNGTQLMVLPELGKKLVQATYRNKDIMITALQPKLAPMGMAEYEDAVAEAFKMLNESQNYDNSNCQKIIMIISDGSPTNCEKQFEQYNPNKSVRVFTYIIGQSVTEIQPVREMACNNRGFSTQIATLADVKENVQSYLDVIARTNALKRDDFTIWTQVHVEQMKSKNNGTTNDSSPTSSTSTDSNADVNIQSMIRPVKDLKMDMYVSVAQATYDLRNATRMENRGVLLGVAGVDVLTESFYRLTPPWEMGLRGYSFMSTNNGFIIYHPNFRPTHGDILKPYYQNVDIAEVEIPANFTLAYADLYPNYNTFQLRGNMVDQSTGSITMKVNYISDAFVHFQSTNMKYFYDFIPGTTYSFALVYPWDEDETADKSQPIPDFKASSIDISPGKVNLASFSPTLDSNNCSKSVYNQGNSSIYFSPHMFCQFSDDLSADYYRDPLCALAKVLNNSRRYSSSCSNDTEYLKAVYKDAMETQNFPVKWKEQWGKNQDYLKETGVDQVFFFHLTGLIRTYNTSMPCYQYFIEDNLEGTQSALYRTTYLLSKIDPDILFFNPPLTNVINQLKSVNSTPHITVSSAISEFGVLGLQFNYSYLKQVFKNSFTCPDDWNCYLVTTSGIVMASNDEDTVGKPLQNVDCPLMEELVNKSIFMKQQLYDFQAICTKSVGGSKNAAARLLQPINFLIKLSFSLVWQLFTILTDLSLSLWWNIMSVHSQVNPTYEALTDSSSSKGKAYSKCTWNFTAHMTTSTANGNSGLYCEDRKWLAEPVKGTNLMLIAATENSKCPCQFYTIQLSGQKVESNKTLASLITSAHRKLPGTWNCTLSENENSTRCTSGSIRVMLSVRLFLSSMLLFLLGHWTMLLM